MHRILIMGAGKIGSLISFLLAHSGEYSVFLADKQETNPHLGRLGQLPHFKYVVLDAKDENAVSAFIQAHQIEALVSSLPFYVNIHIANVAIANKIHYFDLTEDVKTARSVREMAKSTNAAIVPQCGLAPGFISIVTDHLIQKFQTLNTIKMRVGALPINISNALQYSLTWSTDGLINEYGNQCEAIENDKLVSVSPLEGLEEIKIDGITYEAFNTSGGIGSLVESYVGKVKNLSYKTIRYPGHCDKIKFLMEDLKLNDDRETLKTIFENAIPKTNQDVVIVYVSVNGQQHHQFVEESYVRKFYPQRINEVSWSAIQLATATDICAVIDIIFKNPGRYQGYVRHESFTYEDIASNQFGAYYR